MADYLEIERTRLGDRLSWTLAVAPGLEGCEIPRFALQTLVENSVKHANAPRPPPTDRALTRLARTPH